MTYLGIVLIFLFIFSLFRPYGYTVGLLLITCIFQASSVLDINGKGIQPYLLGSGFLIIRCMLETPKLIFYFFFRSRFVLVILFFIFYSVIVTILMPFYFEGINVFDKGLDDSVLNGGIKLKFGVNNVTQLGYLFINCIALCCLWVNKHRIRRRLLLNYFYLSIVFFLVIGFWEFIVKCVGGYFPTSFFYNNYSMGGDAYLVSVGGIMRMNATMTEASFCGAMLSASFWGIMTVFYKTSKLRYLVLICLIAIALVFNLSGTGFVTFLLGGIVFIAVIGINWKVIFRILAIGLLLWGLIYASSYWSYIVDMFLNKHETQSGIVRMMAILNSWDLFCYTWGLGIGMGSNRGGSFPLDLLSSLGLIGTVLFYVIFMKLIFHCRKQNEGKYICVYLLVLMIAQTIAIPDFSFCCMWLGMYMAATFNLKDENSFCNP